MKKSRPDWDSYFMEIACIVLKRSTCMRRNVGALIVKDKRILASGYNGAPTGLKHCMDLSCLREQMKIAPGERHELCRGLHAEQNAIIQAAYHGVSINRAHLYCTHLPCSICIKMLINAGIEKIFYMEGYPDDLASRLMNESSIIIEKVTLRGAEDHLRTISPKKTEALKGVKKQKHKKVPGKP